MKQSFLYSLLFLFFAISSCRKEDNPKLPDIARVPTPLITKVDGTDKVISSQDPASFKGKFIVDLFFKTDVPPQKFDVVIMKNDDKTTVKTFKENVTTFPTTFDITSEQLATLFGAPIVLGDKFEIGVDVTTKEGLKFQAFPLVGEGYGSGVASQAGASTDIRYEAVCKYNPDLYKGTFVVEEDEWEDYAPGDEVEISQVDDTHLTFTHVAAVGAIPITIVINPDDNSASIAKQEIGTRWAYGASYTKPFVATAGAASNSYVSPCEESIILNLQYGYSAGTWSGNYILKLKKK